MDMLIWIGAAVTLTGLAALLWCLVSIAKARGANLPDDELRARLQKAVTLNLGALFLSVIGLMMVVVGIMLG